MPLNQNSSSGFGVQIKSMQANANQELQKQFRWELYNQRNVLIVKEEVSEINRSIAGILLKAKTNQKVF